MVSVCTVNFTVWTHLLSVCPSLIITVAPFNLQTKLSRVSQKPLSVFTAPWYVSWHLSLVWRTSLFLWWAKFPAWLRRPWKSFQSGRPPHSRPVRRETKRGEQQLLAVFRGCQLVTLWLLSQNGWHTKRSDQVRPGLLQKLPSNVRKGTP